jgi:polyphosphate glucokinase
MKILVIDVGGSHVKLLATDATEPRRFDSGPTLTPAELVAQTRAHVDDWTFEAVSLGYPGRVGPDGPIAEPGNLGDGWLSFDFEKAFAVPVRIINDAAMQALGAYDGGRMLFLGLGTGLGSALVVDRVVVPLELGSLPSGESTLAERLGKDGLERTGVEVWADAVREATQALRVAFHADYIMLGGGNAERMARLPEHVRRGGNDDAFAGGFRLWEEEVVPHDRPHSHIWRVVN